MRTDRRFVVAILASYFAVGLAMPWSPDDLAGLGPIALAHMFALSFLFFGWCRAHAEAIGIKAPFGAPFLLGAAAPIGLPYYSIRALGWKSGAWLCVKGVGLVLLGTVLSGVGILTSTLIRA